MTKGAGLTRRSYVEEASPGCDTARQSPPGAPSVCAPTPPTSAPPAAARPRPSSPAPSLRERPSGKLRKPGTELILVIYPKKKKKKKIGPLSTGNSFPTYLFDLVPGLLPLFDLLLGLVQLSKEASHIAAAAAGR